MRFIRFLFDKLIDLFTGRYITPGKRKIDIDLSDLFSDYAEPAADDTHLTDEFKSFSSTADYNRELLSVFQIHKMDIVLDRSHKDGHFRV
jgi:hypothetical protein